MFIVFLVFVTIKVYILSTSLYFFTTECIIFQSSYVSSNKNHNFISLLHYLSLIGLCKISNDVDRETCILFSLIFINKKKWIQSTSLWFILKNDLNNDNDIYPPQTFISGHQPNLSVQQDGHWSSHSTLTQCSLRLR